MPLLSLKIRSSSLTKLTILIRGRIFWKPCTLFVSIFTWNYRYWNQVFQELTDIVSSTQPEQLILMFVTQYVSNRSLTIGCYHIYVPHSREYESMAPNKGSQNITLRRRVPIVKIKPFLKKKKKTREWNTITSETCYLRIFQIFIAPLVSFASSDDRITCFFFIF